MKAFLMSLVMLLSFGAHLYANDLSGSIILAEDSSDEEAEELLDSDFESDDDAPAPEVKNEIKAGNQPTVPPPAVAPPPVDITNDVNQVIDEEMKEAKAPTKKATKADKVAKKGGAGKMRTTTSKCNLRKKPDVKGKLIKSIGPKSKIWTETHNDKWVKVSLKDGKPAYMSVDCFK